MNLKTNLIALGCFALISFAATQASAETKFKGVGLKLHGSFASANYEDGSDLNDLVNSKIGFGGGLQALIEFHPLIAFQPEALFINKGHNFKVSDPVAVSTTVSTNYIQVPLLLVLQLPVPIIKPKLMVGPHLAYFLSGSQTTDSTDSNNKSVSQTNELNGDDIESIDLGVTAAIGADISLDSYTLTLDLRWERGFFGASAAADNVPDFTHTATSVNIGVMYTF